MRFFGDCAYKTFENVLQNLAKHFFMSPVTSEFGGGLYMRPLRPQKHCFRPRTGIFCQFLAKNAVFFVLAARKHFITCSNSLRNLFLEERTQIQPVTFFMFSLGLHLVFPGLH